MTIEIKLTKGAVAMISDEDADLAELKWHTHSEGYAVRKPNTGIIRMHRVIVSRMLGRELASNEDVDHIDRNRTNNQRENLRVATRSENLRNGSIRPNNTSGYRGVSRYNGNPNWNLKRRWQAQLWVNKKHYHLGYYETPEEAAKAYNEAIDKFYGGFGRKNELKG